MEKVVEALGIAFALAFALALILAFVSAWLALGMALWQLVGGATKNWWWLWKALAHFGVILFILHPFIAHSNNRKK